MRTILYFFNQVPHLKQPRHLSMQQPTSAYSLILIHDQQIIEMKETHVKEMDQLKESIDLQGCLNFAMTKIKDLKEKLVSPRQMDPWRQRVLP